MTALYSPTASALPRSLRVWGKAAGGCTRASVAQWKKERITDDRKRKIQNKVGSVTINNKQVHQWLLQSFCSCEKEILLRWQSGRFLGSFYLDWNPTLPPQIMNWPQWPITLWQNITHDLSSGKATIKPLKWHITYCSVSWEEVLWFKDRTGSTLLLQAEQLSSRHSVGQELSASSWPYVSWLPLGLGQLHLTGRVKYFLFEEPGLQHLSCAVTKRNLCCSKSWLQLSQSAPSGSCGSIRWIAFIDTSLMVRMLQFQCSHT